MYTENQIVFFKQKLGNEEIINHLYFAEYFIEMLQVQDRNLVEIYILKYD